MSDIFAKRVSQRRWLLVVPLIAVLSVFLLEAGTPEMRVTPSLLTIALAIFALFLSPRAVLWWAVVLLVPVVLTLWLIPNDGVRETTEFVVLRSFAYIAVAWVAIGLSRYRWNSERQLKGLLALFDALKTPIVVSDIDGNINFSNQACCNLLGREAAELKDTNFFSVFSQPDQRGKSIERYLKFFDKAANESSSMMVSVQKAGREMSCSANCFTMQWDDKKLLVTQLG